MEEKAPVAYIDAFGRLTIGLWYPDMNYRDPEAYHPYWEYKSTQQMEGDIPRVIVERNTPDNMQWLADFYDKLSYENTYQKIPVVSMFFSSGMTCWIMLLYAGWCIYIKKYKHFSCVYIRIRALVDAPAGSGSIVIAIYILL